MSNRDIVSDAFDAWTNGTGYISSIFAPEMRWEIAGRSAASRRYESTAEFVAEVLQPFGARFSAEAPFKPVRIRGLYSDDEQSMVVIVWDGEGTTTAGTTYSNTYAWFLTMKDGLVVEGTAFYDSIAFNELWDGVQPAHQST